MSQKFGTTEAEEDLDKIQECRDIAKTIIDHGVSQTQILLIIQFLGQELEIHENMVEVVTMSRELLKGNRVLLIDQSEEEPNNGTFNN